MIVFDCLTTTRKGAPAHALYYPKTARALLLDNQSAVAQVFQRDLVKMRLETARALVKVLSDGQVGARIVGHGRDSHTAALLLLTAGAAPTGCAGARH